MHIRKTFGSVHILSVVIFLFLSVFIKARDLILYDNYWCFLFCNLVICSSFAERNLNPKAACLKRREEEKSEEQQAGRSMVVPPLDIGHQVPLVSLYAFMVI